VSPLGPTPAGGPALWDWLCPPTFIDAETPGSPRFLANPAVPAPRPPTPVGSTCLAITTCRLGPRLCPTPKAPDHHDNFEAQSRGFGTRCLRFAPLVAPR